MLLADPRELRDAVPHGGRLLGLDVGTKTIGTALSDTRLVIASPLETIRRRRFRDDVAALFALADRHGVGGLVIGLPLTLLGGDGPRTQSVRQFARNLLAVHDVPMAFWDERPSTASPPPISCRAASTRSGVASDARVSRWLRLLGLALGVAIVVWLVAHAD